MNKFIIGCDADGVLVDMYNFYLREGRKFFKKEPLDLEAYDIKDMFGVSVKQKFLFGLKNYTKYCKSEPPINGASEIISKLNDEGNELHQITARMFTTNSGIIGNIYRQMFEKWCRKNNMYFNSFEYCSEDYSPRDKLIACKKLCVDVMIDDKPEVAIFLADNGVKVLLFDTPYNQGLEHSNIIRVKTWCDIYNEIQKLKLNLNPREEFKKLNIEEKEKLNEEEKNKYFKDYYHHLKNLDINEKALMSGNKRFKLIYTFAYLPIKIRFNPKVEGKENIPYQNGFIVASNHLNSYDQYIIGYALGNKAMTGFMASTIKDTFRGRLLSYTKSAVFIDREDSESKKRGEEELSKRIIHGQTALIFPEGTRKNKTEEGRKKILLEFKKGTVVIAQKTGAPILPVAISYQKNKSIIKIGEVIYIKPTDNIDDTNRRLRDTIEQMCIEAEQKVYKKRG